MTQGFLASTDGGEPQYFFDNGGKPATRTRSRGARASTRADRGRSTLLFGTTTVTDGCGPEPHGRDRRHGAG